MTDAARRVAAPVKLVCLVGFVLAVVTTPTRAVGAFVLHGILLATVAVIARVPLGKLARRLVVLVPFAAFAAGLAVLGPAPTRSVAGMDLSIEGLWAAWGILAKASLGVGAATVVAATTSAAELVDGLGRLRLPAVLVGIAAFMVRYGDVVRDDLARMQVARVVRGDDPRWFFQGRAIAATAGALFVRSFERGERVHHAMLARGYNGSMPTLPARIPVRWFPTAGIPLIAGAILAAAHLLG